MGSGWSKSSGCSGEECDFHDKKGEVISSSSSSASSNVSLKESSESRTTYLTPIKPSDTPAMSSVPQVEEEVLQEPSHPHEMTMMDAIHRAIASRDEKARQLHAVSGLYERLRYEVDQANHEVNVLNHEFSSSYGRSPFGQNLENMAFLNETSI